MHDTVSEEEEPQLIKTEQEMEPDSQGQTSDDNVGVNLVLSSSEDVVVFQDLAEKMGKTLGLP